MKKYPFKINEFNVFYGNLESEKDCQPMQKSFKFKVVNYNKLSKKNFIYLENNKNNILLISDEEYNELLR